MLIDCSCGATNRIPGASAVRHRCGKCKHTFTPQELVKARHEPPPPRPTLEDMLSGGSLGQMFSNGDEPTHACNDASSTWTL